MSLYNVYAKTDLFIEIADSEYNQEEYWTARKRLDKQSRVCSDLLSDDPSDVSWNEALALTRYAVKHMARMYPKYRIEYNVTAQSHTGDKTVMYIVMATHEERAKYFFHTKYPHTEYRVTDVCPL